jgi:ethanolamine ammonia-lyase small subunit
MSGDGGCGCGGKCGGNCASKGGCSGDCANCPNKKRKEAEAALMALVREVVVEVVREVEAAEAAMPTAEPTTVHPERSRRVPTTENAPDATQPDRKSAGFSAQPERKTATAPEPDDSPIWSRGPKHKKLPAYRVPAAAEALKRATPARLLQGRTGTRYLTESYLGLRADHATAIDAVASEVPDAWVAQQGWLPLKTRAKDKQHYLLHPEAGRRLDDASKQACAAAPGNGVDVQLIAGDGLSAVALMENGPATIRALEQALPAAGLTVGKTVFVRFARIGVADEIGLLTRAKCTVILVGERPGLGTGDSLSIYTAFSPRLGQDNSEKDCISNVRALGFPPAEATHKCVELLKRTFAAGGGGVKLTGKGTR